MNITAAQIVEWIIAILPSLVAIISFVGITIKTLKEFRESKSEIFTFKDLTEVKKELKEVKNLLKKEVQDNYDLKKQMNELLTKIDHIKRK